MENLFATLENVKVDYSNLIDQQIYNELSFAEKKMNSDLSYLKSVSETFESTVVNMYFVEEKKLREMYRDNYYSSVETCVSDSIDTFKQKINLTVISIKDRFIEKVYSTINCFYKTDLKNSEVLNRYRKETKEVPTLEKILSGILKEMPDLSKAGENLVKEKLLNACKRWQETKHNIKITKEKISFPNIIYYDMSWDKKDFRLFWNFKETKLYHLKNALDMFLNESTCMFNEIHNSRNREVDFNMIYSTRGNLLEYKFFKNGKLDVIFKDSKTAYEFVKWVGFKLEE